MTDTFKCAIASKYCGPTNTKGSRIRVTANKITKWYSYNQELSVNDNHMQAIVEFQTAMGWKGELFFGWTATGAVAVMADRTNA